MRYVYGVLGLMVLLAVVGCGAGGTGSATGKSQASGTNSAPTAVGPGAILPEGSKIEFIGTKPNGKHDGGFKSFTGSIKPVGEDFAKCTISIDLDIDSLYTDADPKLGGHLRSPDFFDVKKYPQSKFVSTAIKAEAKDGVTHVITGDLTLHGTTKSVTFPAKLGTTDDAVTLDGTFSIDRTEYGIAYDPAQVNKDVTIKVSIKAARK